MIVAPESFNLTNAGLIALGKMAFVGAIVGMALYLKQSPIPQDEPDK